MRSESLFAILNCIYRVSTMLQCLPTFDFHARDFQGSADVAGLEEARVDRSWHRLIAIVECDWNAYERSWDFQSFPS